MAVRSQRLVLVAAAVAALLPSAWRASGVWKEATDFQAGGRLGHGHGSDSDELHTIAEYAAAQGIALDNESARENKRSQLPSLSDATTGANASQTTAFAGNSAGHSASGALLGSHASMSGLPGLIIAGQQKAGTTSLWRYLRMRRAEEGHDKSSHQADAAHKFCHGKCVPSVMAKSEDLFCDEKESHFFSMNKDLFWSPTEDVADDLRSVYAECGDAQVAVDATPSNFDHPSRVRYLYESIDPKVADSLRVIITLRDPIQRHLSWYNHQRLDYADHKKVYEFPHGHKVDVLAADKTFYAFDEYVDHIIIPGLKEQRDSFGGEFHRGIDHRYSGTFAAQVKEWLTLFKPSQVLFLSYSEMKANPSMYLSRVRGFLGLNKLVYGDSMEHKNTHAESGKVLEMKCSTRDKLEALFAEEIKSVRETLIMHADASPSMQQRPFGEFERAPCNEAENEVLEVD